MNSANLTGTRSFCAGMIFASLSASRSDCKRTRVSRASLPHANIVVRQETPATILRPAPGAQSLLVSRFDAFAAAIVHAGQTARPAGRRADRHRQPARRGGVRAGGEGGGHQTDPRHGTARGGEAAAALRRIGARLSQSLPPALATMRSERPRMRRRQRSRRNSAAPFACDEFDGFTDGLIAVEPSYAELAELFPGSFYATGHGRARHLGDFPCVACPAIHYAAPRTGRNTTSCKAFAR